MKALLKAAEGTDLYSLWVLLTTTGLRIGEALALRWDDLDLEGRTLRVNRTVFRGEVIPNPLEGSCIFAAGRPTPRSEHGSQRWRRDFLTLCRQQQNR